MPRPSSYGTFEAWLRQGSKEFAQALQALPDSIQHVHEPGMLGAPTSQQVTEAVKGQPSMEKAVEPKATVHGEKEAEKPAAEASVNEKPAPAAEKSEYEKSVEQYAAREQPQQEKDRER